MPSNYDPEIESLARVECEEVWDDTAPELYGYWADEPKTPEPVAAPEADDDLPF